MADYYSLLARAVANLPKSSPPSTRRAIYERARKALTNQLRSLKPQLPESDIAREERALDEAVARLEADFEPASGELHTLPGPATAVEPGEPALTASSPPMPAASAEAPPPLQTQAPATPPPPAPRPPRPVQPPVSRMPAGSARPTAPLAPPRTPLPPLAPKPNARAAATGLPNAAAFKPPTLGPAAPPLMADDDEGIYEPTLGAAQAPFGVQTAEAPSPPVGPPGDRYEREALRPTLSDAKRRATPTWIWIAGAVAVGFAGSIAVAAYLMRPALRDLTVAAPVDTPSPTTTAPLEKLPSRVGPITSDAAPPSPTESAPPSPEASASPEASPSPSASPEASAPPVAAPPVAAPPTAAPTVPIATRAAMLVATVADASKPAISVGTAVWSIVPAPPGQPAAIGVKAEIDIPDLKMHVSMIIRKNFDANLPASHTIDLRMNFDPSSTIKGVKDIALPLMRRDDPPAADALSGVRVKISDNYFLIGLNRGDADVARNVQEIGERAWFDFPMQLDDDRIAKLTFEKGGDGEKAVAQALAAWK